MQILKIEGQKNVSLVEAPEPSPGPGEVLVKTAVSGLCGSELHAYLGEGMPRGNTGHEAAGTVIKVGEGVSNFLVGQRVGASAVAGCGMCAYCARGQYTWCSDRRFYGSMHADHFLAHANACHPLPEDVSWEAGVLLSGDGLGVPFHTSSKIAAPDIHNVAVFGVGPIGLGNVLVQSFLGRQVIAVDLSAWRLEKARQIGAAHIINPQDVDPAEQVRQLTGGVGADVCIEAAGKPETALACFAAVRTAGTVVFNGEQGAIPLSPSDQFIRRDITAVGAWYYHFSEFNQMLKLYRRGLRLLDLVSHHFPFREAGAAFEKFSSRQSAKVLLDYS